MPQRAAAPNAPPGSLAARVQAIAEGRVAAPNAPPGMSISSSPSSLEDRVRQIAQSQNMPVPPGRGATGSWDEPPTVFGGLSNIASSTGRLVSGVAGMVAHP